MARHDIDPFAVAYDYAWWLTGDDERAARAVLSTNGERELSELLSSVRRTAITERTMCPASELALLHDRARLPLDLAATIAVVPTADARTELAHGRLEALEQAVDTAFVHPERLGGLAVANPADVAHARTCADCARALDALRDGRGALESIPVHRPVDQQSSAGAPADASAADASGGEPDRVPAWAWLLAIAMAAAAGVGAFLGWP